MGLYLRQDAFWSTSARRPRHGSANLRVMTAVEVYVDPSCPWAWITSRWIKAVAPDRGLEVTWPSYCIEIRDDYGVAPTMPPDHRQAAITAHALSHRMLRVLRRPGRAAAKGRWTRCTPSGARFFVRGAERRAAARTVAAAGLDLDLVDAADDDKWDGPIMESMEIAYAFGGKKPRPPRSSFARPAARVQGSGDGAGADRRGRR